MCQCSEIYLRVYAGGDDDGNNCNGKGGGASVLWLGGDSAAKLPKAAQWCVPSRPGGE